jgi:hypothetical protein
MVQELKNIAPPPIIKGSKKLLIFNYYNLFSKKFTFYFIFLENVENKTSENS